MGKILLPTQCIQNDLVFGQGIHMKGNLDTKNVGAQKCSCMLEVINHLTYQDHMSDQVSSESSKSVIHQGLKTKSLVI